MSRCLYIFTIAIYILLSVGCETTNPPRDIRNLQVLFLGHDSEHHNSAAYLPLLSGTFGRDGIFFTYTEDPDDLNYDNLVKYDALMLYANHDSISSQQEKALMQYVKGGGGFLPIHCASYCFRNSKAYVKLVGGQFVSHDTARFTATIVRPEHEVMANLEEFETWDETYVHVHSDAQRTILMERVEGEHREPYTWTREVGKGRVFYTALGHDEQTWSHSGFQHLVKNAILWAVGNEKKRIFESLSFPQLQYSPAKIANYERRDPPPQLQAPLSPEESQQITQVPVDFDLQLFASEPDIINPMSLAWDHRGRLWILESVDYPNEIQIEEGVGNDRIKILEDTDNDGKADKFTIFADKLSVPTSLVFADGGVIVSQAPHFLFLKDEDGDDKADVRKIIMSGWGTFDTHAGPSNLKYGFDNQIWGVVGYSGFEGVVGTQNHEFRQGIYRFQKDGSSLEFMSATTNNTWGLGFSENFDVFISTANNTHSGYMGIPRRFLEQAQGLNMKDVEKIDGHYAFHPITHNYRQVDVFGGFTAAAGHNLYTARDFPQAYWNRIAFVCEPTGNLLHNAVLEPDGAGFVEKDGWNILASADEWMSPVHAEVGPDGALWILDWYNFIIQHNPTPPGFDNGLGNAHINPLRDRQHGRIYRVSYKTSDPKPYPVLDPKDAAGLVAELSNDNLLWRLHAQRLLVEEDHKSTKNDLIRLVQDQSVDAIGISPGAIHSLWALHGLGLISDGYSEVLEAVYQALEHPSAGVRRTALLVMPRNEKSLTEMLHRYNLNDRDAQVRLAAILALGEMPTTDSIGQILFELSQDRSLLRDDWLARATYGVAVQHKETFIKAVHSQRPDLIQQDQSGAPSEIRGADPELDDSDWGKIRVPSWWSQTGVPELNQFDGVVWHRKVIELSEAQASSQLRLHLGIVDDTDDTYFNGARIGGMIRRWDGVREYPVPRNIVRPGENLIAIRVEDNSGGGGMRSPPEDVYLQAGNDRIPLAGEWKFKMAEVFRSGQSAFSGGKGIVELFLENYGPFAKQLTADLTSNTDEYDRKIILQTIPGQNKFDKSEINAFAGERILIEFTNNDLSMQHNIVLAEPGSLDVIGRISDKMVETNQNSDNYVPPISQVLSSTGLVNPGEMVQLFFDVPEEPGDYVFVCTFPGHWLSMNGVLKVRKPNI